MKFYNENKQVAKKSIVNILEQNKIQLSNKPSTIMLRPTWKEYYDFKVTEKLSKSQMNIKRKVGVDILALMKSTDDLKQININKLMATYEEKYRVNSIRKYVAEIKCFLNYCVKAGYLSYSDIYRLSFPNIKVKVSQTYINNYDLDHIFNYIRNNYLDLYVFIASVYYLCCRPKEIQEIKKEDIHFDEKTCTIWMNKTKKYKNIVVTNDEYFEFLKQYLKNLPNDSYICRYPFSKDHYSYVFKRLKLKLGLNPMYNLYTLRHTCGTNLYKATKDIKFVASQLGDTIETVMKHYVNLDIDHYKQYSNVL